MRKKNAEVSETRALQQSYEIERLLARLINECGRATRETDDRDELSGALLDSALLRCVLDAMRNRDALGFKVECDCNMPFKIIATKGCEHHAGRSR